MRDINHFSNICHLAAHKILRKVAANVCNLLNWKCSTGVKKAGHQNVDRFSKFFRHQTRQ